MQGKKSSTFIDQIKFPSTLPSLISITIHYSWMNAYAHTHLMHWSILNLCVNFSLMYQFTNEKRKKENRIDFISIFETIELISIKWDIYLFLLSGLFCQASRHHFSTISLFHFHTIFAFINKLFTPKKRNSFGFEWHFELSFPLDL